MMAQEAAFREIANNRLRKSKAYTKSFNLTDVKIGDAALFYSAAKKKSTPRWRVPALILDFGETGVTVNFQSQTFKAARFCCVRAGC